MANCSLCSIKLVSLCDICWFIPFRASVFWLWKSTRIISQRRHLWMPIWRGSSILLICILIGLCPAFLFSNITWIALLLLTYWALLDLGLLLTITSVGWRNFIGSILFDFGISIWIWRFGFAILWAGLLHLREVQSAAISRLRFGIIWLSPCNLLIPSWRFIISQRHFLPLILKCR